MKEIWIGPDYTEASDKELLKEYHEILQEVLKRFGNKNI
jgi:hypothetical protein